MRSTCKGTTLMRKLIALMPGKIFLRLRTGSLHVVTCFNKVMVHSCFLTKYKVVQSAKQTILKQGQMLKGLDVALLLIVLSYEVHAQQVIHYFAQPSSSPGACNSASNNNQTAGSLCTGDILVTSWLEYIKEWQPTCKLKVIIIAHTVAIASYLYVN